MGKQKIDVDTYKFQSGQTIDEILNEEKLEKLRMSLKTALNEVSKPFEIIPFSRENYNKLFPNSRVQSPIEVVKLGAHQFEKLDDKERQTILKSVHDVLNNPDMIINEERESVFGDINYAHVYAKSFKMNEKNKAIQSIVVAIEDENISISTHTRDINNVVNKIKKPDQLIYLSAEIGQMIERMTGIQLETVNPTRENEKFTPPNSIISQNEEKSTIELMKEKLDQKKNVNPYTNEILDKIRAAGINVEISSEKIQEILKLRKDISKMTVDIQEFEEKKNEIEKIRNYIPKLSDENKALVREQEFIDFQTSLIACKKFIEDLPDNKLPDIKWNIENSKGEEIDIDLIVQKKDEHLVLTTLSNGIVYDFETKEIENNFLFNAFKDYNSVNNCCDVLVKAINDNLGKQLGEQRSKLKKLMQENAVLSGKALNELSEEETKELKEKLKELDYENIEGILVHKDKKIALTPEDYVKEVMNAKLLVDHNHTVYLLPENFAFRKINELGQNESNSTPDTLTDDEFVELKTTDKKLGSRFGEAVEQANSVLIRIQDDISIYNARKRLQNKIKNLPNEKGIEVKDGKLFLYFEKKGQYVEAEIKQGKINILPAGPRLADYSVVPPAGNILSQAEELSSSFPKINKMITEASSGLVAGVAFDNNIILHPDYLTNAAVHEYTHLWDAYIQKTNSELWDKGLEIFRDTKYWNEVISDPNYQDIKDDENLVLSEIHSRICGDIAEKVLERIAELDGEKVKLDAIDWNEETWNYICEEMTADKNLNYENGISSKDLKNFLSMPMKDLIDEKNISRSTEENHLQSDGKTASVHEENIENFSQTADDNSMDTSKPVVYGQTVLPGFSIMIDGHLTECDDYVVKEYNKSNGTYLIQKGDDKIELPKESLETILNPGSLYEKKEIETLKQASGNGVVFQDKENNVKGTVIPEFTLLTSDGFKNYKDCVVTSYDKEFKVYTLENENSSVVVPEDKFNEIISPERFETNTRLSEDAKPYDKMLKTQYEDYFNERANTARNFIHNLEVKCRKEASNPCDSLKVAKAIIDKMPKGEQKKLQRTLELIKKEDETLNSFMIRVYHRAVSNLPVNEEYMKKNYPSNVIARPFYDVIYENGQKISEDRDLIQNGKDYNLRIGDTLKDVVLNADNAIGRGKTSIIIDELKIISASKEGNSLTLVDKHNSYYTLPRDTILQNYKQQQQKEFKREQKNHKMSNQMQYSYQ